LYPSAIWKVPTKEKKIFLTFDDGPVPEITPWVLSMLKEFNAKAAFFCVGANIEKYHEIYRQLISEGHAIGNHTYDHLNGWKTSTKEYLENVYRCDSTIKSQVPSLKSQEKKNISPSIRRMKLPQYSILNTQYSLIMWDVLSGDFDQTISEEKCLKNVLAKTREGSIVVFTTV